MIIHIAGPSGSGKTTLGNKINKYKDFVVIDTDDIDDSNFNKLIKNNNEFKKSIFGKSNRKWREILENKNLDELNRIINKVKKQNKILVIVGISFDFSKASPTKISDKKYFIKVDDDILFRRVNLRMLDDIVKNKLKLKKLFQNEKVKMLDIITHKLSHNFNLRGPFIETYFEAIANNKQKQKEYKNNNYKILTPDKIYKEILGFKR